MPQETLRQTAFTGGELDPLLIARRDLKAYFMACSSMSNMLPMAQGPARRRPGSAFVDRVRAPLLAIPLISEDMGLSAPNGGDISSAISPAETTALVTVTAMGATAPFVVLDMSFSAPVAVNAIDLAGYAAVPAGTGWTDPVPPSKPTYPWHPPGYFGGQLP